jgi:ATP-binding protein involved in chromosome partitioning
MASDYGVDLLGSLPLDIRIRQEADSGRPTVIADPDGRIAGIYRAIARKVAVRIADLQRDHSSAFPKIVIKGG